MYFLSNEERRLISGRLLAEIRATGVAEELRGWNWSKPPLAPIYDCPLTVSAVASSGCGSGRDVFLRYVLGRREQAAAHSQGSQLRATARQVILAAKRIIYQHGSSCLPALSELITEARGGSKYRVAVEPMQAAAFSAAGNSATTRATVFGPADPVWQALVGTGEMVVKSGETTANSKELLTATNAPAPLYANLMRVVWEFEARRVMQVVEEILSSAPLLGADAIVARALPIMVGYWLDGGLLGLGRRELVDIMLPGMPLPTLVRCGPRRAEHRLLTTGYALIAESMWEQPVDVGCVVYVRFRAGQVRLERDLHIIGDELRQEFVELRDQRMRMIEEEIDPGVLPDCYEACPVPGRCHRQE